MVGFGFDEPLAALQPSPFPSPIPAPHIAQFARILHNSRWKKSHLRGNRSGMVL
jgi:hypothetical protein